MTRTDGLVRTPDGDLVPEEQVERSRDHLTLLPDVSGPQECPEGCDAGWIGPAALPAPCPVCRPETVARLRAQREKCTVCRTRLDAYLVEEGYRTHPACDPYEEPRGSA